MSDNIYERLSEERKKLQEEGELPEWYSTGGWQLFKSKYLYETKGFKGQAQRIAKTAAKHTTLENAETRFFDLLWKGWLSPSTPVLANMGTDRGLPVSCSGGYIGDGIYEFYESLKEAAILSKHGFGTSGYLGDIRPRGSKISIGGTASGIMPVIKDFVIMSRNVSQGSQRRGAWAGYLPVEHGDFWELVTYIEQNPDDLNIGWVITDEFISKLDNNDEETTNRFKRILKVKMVTGKGYFFFVDKVNRHRPECYKVHNLDIKGSNLCSEIMLHSSDEYTYTCVLSSLNVALYDEWKDTDAAFVATVFLDCVAQEFIERAKNIKGLDKAIAFTENGRALGLGVCGFHTYLQTHMIPFDSVEAMIFNDELFQSISEKSKDASRWMASIHGEPEWCVGTGMRNTHTTTCMPTKSTALLMGGVSEGINPDPAMTYTQTSAGGEIERISRPLYDHMISTGIFSKAKIKEVIAKNGSVQDVDWLTDEEKLVFRTAFEIPQESIIILASNRQEFIDQGQSLNLFFSSEEKPEYIAKIHKMAFKDENILSLYYVYSMAGVKASTGECEACQ